jgi:hypothetical protein
MNIRVIGVETNDFFDMMNDDTYKTAFFIYCDVEEYCYLCDDEDGYKRVRKFNNYQFRRCIGIPVCSRTDGCYKGINTFTRQMIDKSFRHIVVSMYEHGFDTLYYQISDQISDQLDIGIRVFEEHPFVHNTVVQYIMNKIYKMTTEPIRLIVKR